jgi:hypothetical protein
MDAAISINILLDIDTLELILLSKSLTILSLKIENLHVTMSEKEGTHVV